MKLVVQTGCFVAAAVVLVAAPKSGKTDPTEVFFTNASVPSLQIELDAAARAALLQEPRAYVRGTVKEGGTVYQHVGVHLKGQYGTFQTVDGRPSLTLNFDKFVETQDFHGLEKIHINNSVSDSSLMAELFCGDIFRAAGVPVSRRTHARVTLNGRDLGLYVLVEGYNKAFLRRHFEKANGNFYESGFSHDIHEPLKKASGKGVDDHSDLKELATACQEGDPAKRLEKLGSLVDMDRFHTLMALETLTRHFDGYSMSKNNYWIYHDPTSGKMTFIPYGMDQMFWNPEAAVLPELQGVVARAVLHTAAGRREFQARCSTLFTNLVEPLPKRIEALNQRLRPLVAQCGTNALQVHEKGVSDLKERVRVRLDYLRQQFAEPAPPTIQLAAGKECPLNRWFFSVEKGQATLGATTNKTGVSTPGIGAETEKFVSETNTITMRLEPEALAGWQGRVVLPAGVYRVSAKVSTDQPTFRGNTSPMSLGIYGAEEVELERTNLDTTHAELSCVWAQPAGGPEEVVIQCRARSSSQPQTWIFGSLTLSRLQ